MKNTLIAAFVALLTIGISVRFLTSDDASYDADLPRDRTVEISQTFSAENYDITPTSFSCDEYVRDTEEEVYGCELRMDLVNTSGFEAVVELDGDEAVSTSGQVYKSSQELSEELLENADLIMPIVDGGEIDVGSFFKVDPGDQIDIVRVFEYANTEPIIIDL